MKVILMLLGLLLFSSATIAQSAEKTIGIILPIQHKALDAIVQGFTQTLQENYPQKINFVIQNAQGDVNLQRAIIQKFINQKVTMIVPVATTTAQMTIAMVRQQPIVALAAMIPETERQKMKNHNVTGVEDEISPKKQLALVQGILPQLQKLTLIYSSSDKIIPEVNATIHYAQQANISVQKLMIQNLADLYTMSRQIAKDSQAIMILKDNMVASGINTLIQAAKQRRLPLITQDEGTIRNGAAVALGVRERDIGKTGAELARRVLNGEAIAQIPIQQMTELAVFVNTRASQEQGLNLDAIKRFAQQQHYQVILNP